MREVESPLTFFMMGHCAREGGIRLFVGEPSSSEDGIETVVRSIPLEKGNIYSIGSGAEQFRQFLVGRPGEALDDAMRAFVRSEALASVGGHLQAGRCTKVGFTLPVVTEAVLGTTNQRAMAFVGIDVAEIGEIDGLSIGREAFGPPITPEGARSYLEWRDKDQPERRFGPDSKRKR